MTTICIEINELFYTVLCVNFSLTCATLVMKLITWLEKGGRKQ